MPFAKADVTHRYRADARSRSTARWPSSKAWHASAASPSASLRRLPVSIERIAHWAKELESRGIMLVPLTTAMLKSKSKLRSYR